MEMNICPQCNKSELQNDEVGSVKAKICQNCGFMVEGLSLETGFYHGQAGYSLASETCVENKYKVKVADGYKRISKVNRDILARIETYTTKMPGGTDLYEATKQLFIKLVEENYKAVHFDKRMALAAACLIGISRANGHGVLVTDVCSGLQITQKNVIGLMHTVKSLTQSNTSNAISDLVESLFHQHESLRGRKSLKEAVFDICEFLKDLQLTSYSRQTVVYNALYFALISEQTTSRPRQTLMAFCKEYGMCYKPSSSLHNSIMERFILLAKRLPWVKQPVVKKKIHLYIRDIVKNKRALLSNTAHDNGASFQNKRKASSSAEQQPLENGEKKIKLERDAELPPKITEQMVLEMPPCMIANMQNPPKVKFEQQEPDFVSDSPALNEDDIKDSDIGEYIRTNAEVEMVKRIRSTDEK